MKRSAIILLIVLLFPSLILTVFWRTYLGPRFSVRNYMAAIGPIETKQDKKNSDIKTLLKKTKKQRVGFYDPDERNKLIDRLDQTERKLEGHLKQTEKTKINIKKLAASPKTKPYTLSLLKKTDYTANSVSALIGGVDYFLGLVRILHKYNPEFKAIRSKLPTTATEAMRQLDLTEALTLRLNSELDGLKPPPELEKFHAEFTGTFNAMTLFKETRDAMAQRDLSRLTQLQSRFVLMDASIDGYSVENTYDDLLEKWLKKEEKSFSGSPKEARKLEKTYGRYWTKASY